MLLRRSQDQGFRIGFATLKAVHEGTNNAELFSLFGTHLSVHSGRDFLIGFSLRPWNWRASSDCVLLADSAGEIRLAGHELVFENVGPLKTVFEETGRDWMPAEKLKQSVFPKVNLQGQSPTRLCLKERQATYILGSAACTHAPSRAL